MEFATMNDDAVDRWPSRDAVLLRKSVFMMYGVDMANVTGRVSVKKDNKKNKGTIFTPLIANVSDWRNHSEIWTWFPVALKKTGFPSSTIILIISHFKSSICGTIKTKVEQFCAVCPGYGFSSDVSLVGEHLLLSTASLDSFLWPLVFINTWRWATLEIKNSTAYCKSHASLCDRFSIKTKNLLIINVFKVIWKQYNKRFGWLKLCAFNALGSIGGILKAVLIF